MSIVRGFSNFFNLSAPATPSKPITAKERKDLEIFDYLDSTYSYTPSERTFTGYTDANGKSIYVGDVVKENRNGLVAKVVYDYSRGYCLEGLGEGYEIQHARTEWEVQGPSINLQPKNEQMNKEDDLER